MLQRKNSIIAMSVPQKNTSTLSKGSEIQFMRSMTPVDYQEAIAFMEKRAQQIYEGHAPELLWFLEHPPLYTLGTSAKEKDILNPDRCPIYTTGRGGQVTYHGPGQRICYVMLNLKKRSPDVRAFVRQLEKWLQCTFKHLGLQTTLSPDRVGVWVPGPCGADKKIAALGVRIRRWVTMHGVAINVNPDLSYYKGIVPCGLTNYGVTSLKEQEIDLSDDDLDILLKKQFEETFSVSCR